MEIVALFAVFFIIIFGVGELWHRFFGGSSEAPLIENDALLSTIVSDSQKTMSPWDPEMVKAWEELDGLAEAKPKRHGLELKGEKYLTYIGTKTPGVIHQTTMRLSPFRVVTENTWSRADIGISSWPLLQAVLQQAGEQSRRRQKDDEVHHNVGQPPS